MSTLVIERFFTFRDSSKIRALVSGRKFTAVFIWLSIVVAAWFLARACALALAPSALPPAPAFSSKAVPASQKPGSSMPPFARFSALETNNLFNLKSHTPVASSAKALNAILMGTVEAPLPEDTRAVIQHQGKQYMLAPGQDIAGYVVKEIRRGTVVLEGNGRTVELVTANTGEIPSAVKPGGARGTN